MNNLDFSMSNDLNSSAILKWLLSFILIALVLDSCTSEIQPREDECEGAIALQSNNVIEASCNQSNGGFSISVNGGTGDYTFSLNGSTQSTSSFTNLDAGSYTIRVTDEAGCSSELTVNIQNQDGVNASLESVTNSDCDDQTGSISVAASDGQGPYEYRLNDGAFQANSIFESLSPGTYVVSVKDASGCQVELIAEVRSTVLFTDIRDIIQTNCAISGCHNGSRFPDLRSDNNISAQASRIMSRTASRSMPPSGSGRSLSTEEIEAIACWVNDGAPIN